MRLVMHRPDIGERDDGSWWQNTADGWRKIERPAWAVETEPTEPHPMTDPYERDPEQIRMVTVRRISYKTVTDYEAEVLCSHGWEIVSEDDSNAAAWNP